MKKNNKKKIINVISVLCVIAILIGTACATMVQFPSADQELNDFLRSIYMKNFDQVDLSEKGELKRVIDNKHPLHLLNYYAQEPVEELWKSIPEDIKPYTVMLIIISEKAEGSENYIKKIEEVADRCEELKIPYAISNFCGETHFENRLPISYLEERFAKLHKYFYGLNGAELYNTILWRGELESNNCQYLIDSIKLAAKYGGYFFWTDTNRNYDNGMMVDWFENNELIYSTFKQYNENIVMMNKESFGEPSTYSFMQGLWLAGLIGNYGVSSDWWHWTCNGYKTLFGEYDKYADGNWDRIASYPENMYTQSMALVASRGATCFKAEAPNYSTSVAGESTAGFQYSILPFYRDILNGDIHIPTREEVLENTNMAIVGGENFITLNYNLKESNLYPNSPYYSIIPLLPKNLRLEERAVFLNRGVKLVEEKLSSKELEQYKYSGLTGNTYLCGVGSNWTFINNLENKKGTKSAKFAPHLSKLSSVTVTSDEHSFVIANESTEGISFILNNYRTDKGKMIKEVTAEDRKHVKETWVDINGRYLTLDKNGNPKGVDDSKKRITTITLKGDFGGKKPYIIWKNTPENNENTREYNYYVNYTENEVTIKIEHNGYVKFRVLLEANQLTVNNQEKEPVKETKAKTGADTSELQRYVNSVDVSESGYYSQYGYMQFTALIEKAKVYIQEGTYTEKEISSLLAEVEKYQKRLINIQKYVDILKKVYSGDDESQKVKADRLLKELLSANVYIEGRNNDIDYKLIYRLRSYSNSLVKEKNAKMEKYYDTLANA